MFCWSSLSSSWSNLFHLFHTALRAIHSSGGDNRGFLLRVFSPICRSNFIAVNWRCFFFIVVSSPYRQRYRNPIVLIGLINMITINRLAIPVQSELYAKGHKFLNRKSLAAIDILQKFVRYSCSLFLTNKGVLFEDFLSNQSKFFPLDDRAL